MKALAVVTALMLDHWTSLAIGGYIVHRFRAQVDAGFAVVELLAVNVWKKVFAR